MVRDLKRFNRIPAKNMPLSKKHKRTMVECLGNNRPDKMSEENSWKNKALFEDI